MPAYPSGLDVSSSALRFLAARLREHRRRLGTRWRRLNAGRQALLALVHLRNGHPYDQLAAGFGIATATATAYRYFTEAVDVLAALAPSFVEAVRAASAKAAFFLLNGTLLPIDRIAADRPFCSEEHKKHGMNVQVVTDPLGRPLWASPALPGAVHDIRAAREHGVIDPLAGAGIVCWADKGYQGVGGTARVPHRCRWEKLSTGQQAINRSHAKIRAPGPGRTGHHHPQVLAAPPQAPLLDHPHHQPCSGRPHPASGQLRVKAERLFDAESISEPFSSCL